MTCSAESKADKNKKRNRSDRLTQPDSVGVHHGGFWSRRPRFESESGYFFMGSPVGSFSYHPTRIFMNGMRVDLDQGETMIQSIGVIGAGQMGNGIAQVAACAGYDVVMIDIKDEYVDKGLGTCLLYTSPSPRDLSTSRMPSSA